MVPYKRNRPTIGVLAGWQVFTGTIDSFLEHVIRGIQVAAAERQCNLLLACGSRSLLSFEEGRPAWPIIDERIDFIPVGPWNCNGLIVAPTMSVEACRQYAVHLRDQGFPLVFAGLQGFGPGVGPDNEMGIRQALHHLYEHGHRRIAFIAGFAFDTEGDSGIRLGVYRKTLEELGLSFDPALVAYSAHELVRGRQAMQEILNRQVPFTAVLGSNDLSAMGAIEILRRAGYAVPQDVAVIGFDNRIETRAHVPPLTTVHFPMFELGYQSLTMLLDDIEGRVGPNDVRLIPTHLVVRESCGCPPGGSGNHGQPSGMAERLQEIATIIQIESHHMQRHDATSLAERCLRAFQQSLVSGNPDDFLSTFQGILDRVSRWQDDLYAWQYVISSLRSTPLPENEGLLKRTTIEAMLDQARVMASDAARAQTTRQLIHQVRVAEELETMASKLFVARDEDEIFNTLGQSLPATGIEQNAVFYYEAQGEDRMAWSTLQSPHAALAKGYRFETYQFPPPKLVSEQEPHQLALLPLVIGEQMAGYVAMQAGALEPLSDIVRQLASALYAVRLRQEALEGQRLAEEANRLKSRLLSMVSHELRAPLNLISGLSDILLKSKGTQAPDSFPWSDLERIYTSAQHLDSLIQDVLDLARSDIGQLKITCEPLEVKDVLDSAVAICKTLVTNKGLGWRYEVAEGLPKIWGDRTRLRQVILNLVNNAAKFTERGQVALIAMLDEQGWVAVSVQDTGLGISEAEQEIIFHEFRQAERTTARGYGGLGLGLAICRRLVELHGGEIRVSSSGNEYQGATFTFTLPPWVEQSVARPSAGAEPAGRVLLLVKEQNGSTILKDYLGTQGYEVSVYPVGEGNEWLSWLLIAKPDVVVMDLGLTSERGWEVLKLMKENPATQDIPALFYAISADGQSGSLLELDYLTKPLKSTSLAASLLQHPLSGCWSGPESTPLILVVDDDPPTVDFHARLIQSQFPNVRILPAYNGRQALELIQEQLPALVLLDLMMPEMDGFCVLAEMRQRKSSRDIPVIVITGQKLDQEDITRLNRGVVSILGKGIFSQAETLEHIASFLQHRRKPSFDSQQAILKAMAFIHTNFKEPISRADIAASVGLSERHLDRCFQQGLGLSPITYLNRYRVSQARYLLDTQNMGITTVAMQVGFSSSGYFARVFRDEVGVSPSTYLQQKNSVP